MWKLSIKACVGIHKTPALVRKKLNRLICPLQAEKQMGESVFGRNAFDNGFTFHKVFCRDTSHPLRNPIPLRAGFSCFSKLKGRFPIHLRKPGIVLNILVCNLTLIPRTVEFSGHLAQNLFLFGDGGMPLLLAIGKPLMPIGYYRKFCPSNTKMSRQSGQGGVIL